MVSALRRLMLAAVLVAGAAQAQSPDPNVGARPLEEMLDRPYVLRLWRSNRGFLELNFLKLDADNQALAEGEASQDIFDIDVFVMFLPSFQNPDGIEGHVLEPVLRRELARVRPTDTLRMTSAPMTRNEDGARKNLGVILIDIAAMQGNSDTCLSILLYDAARWFFSSHLEAGLTRSVGRAQTCATEGWRDTAPALAAETAEE